MILVEYGAAIAALTILLVVIRMVLSGELMTRSTAEAMRKTSVDRSGWKPTREPTEEERIMAEAMAEVEEIDKWNGVDG